MIQGLLFLFLAFLLVGIVVVVVIAATVVRTFRKAKQMMDGDDKEKHTKQAQGNDGMATIVDTRREDVANRKIFPKDEGEYVDYTEQ